MTTFYTYPEPTPNLAAGREWMKTRFPGIIPSRNGALSRNQREKPGPGTLNSTREARRTWLVAGFRPDRAGLHSGSETTARRPSAKTAEKHQAVQAACCPLLRRTHGSMAGNREIRSRAGQASARPRTPRPGSGVPAMRSAHAPELSSDHIHISVDFRNSMREHGPWKEEQFHLPLRLVRRQGQSATLDAPRWPVSGQFILRRNGAGGNVCTRRVRFWMFWGFLGGAWMKVLRWKNTREALCVR